MDNRIYNKTKYIQEFKESADDRITRQFLSRTSAHVKQNIDVIIDNISKKLDLFMENIGKSQQRQMIPIGQITISLIRLSAWEEKKLIRIDAYDEEQLLGRNVAYQYIDADWLFTEWNDYHDRLKAEVKSTGKSLYIREATIRQIMDQSIRKLVYLFVSILKYSLNNADYLEHFGTCARSEGFVISAGEYMDWQKVLYAEPPEVDIFFNPNKHPLVFQKYENKRYRDKEFLNLDLRNTRFRHCEFIRCSFEETDLSDTFFIDCKFKNTDMKSGKMYGATFMGCVIENTDMEGIRTKWIPFEDGKEQETDVFRDVRFSGCIIDGELTEDAPSDQTEG